MEANGESESEGTGRDSGMIIHWTKHRWQKGKVEAYGESESGEAQEEKIQ